MFSDDERAQMLNDDDLLDRAARHLTDAGLDVNDVAPVDPGFDARWDVTGPGGTERYAVWIKPTVAAVVVAGGCDARDATVTGRHQVDEQDAAPRTRRRLPRCLRPSSRRS